MRGLGNLQHSVRPGRDLHNEGTAIWDVFKLGGRTAELDFARLRDASI